MKHLIEIIYAIEKLLRSYSIITDYAVLIKYLRSDIHKKMKFTTGEEK